MRKRVFSLLCALLMMMSFLPASAAESFQFEGVNAAVSLPEGVYQPVLTPANLKDNEAFIQQQGGTLAAWQADFEARGILLQAYDTANNRVLVITALQDVDGQRLFDINEHTPDVRAKYRVSHGGSGAYTILGYRYDSISWKSFKNIGRFLQLRYSYRLNGELARRGFQRRTIRNGYTITVDMQVFDRQLTARDNAALNKVFDTFTFTSILPVPPLPLSLDETVTAPVETSKPNFVMKGKTKPEANLRAVLMSFSTSATKVFEAKANKSGAYSLPIELPSQDVYVMTLTVQSAGLEDLNRSYNIRYQAGLIPVSLTSVPSGELLEDQFVLAGSTTESNVKATLTVNGKETTKNVARNGTFSFTFDTKEEGTYTIRLVLTKKGLQDRVFNYTGVRVLSPLAREELLKKSALSPSYTELTQNPNMYDGKMLFYQGTLVAKGNDADNWVLRLALNKTESGFTDILYITSDTDPGFEVNSQVNIYGLMEGMNVAPDAQGNEETLPRISLSLMSEK
ncbi:MAG: hypothetical protein GXZ04_03770 [Clostridiales bacterium]|nr:hypothetical protein [Clostridiales bacterium]